MSSSSSSSRVVRVRTSPKCTTTDERVVSFSFFKKKIFSLDVVSFYSLFLFYLLCPRITRMISCTHSVLVVSAVFFFFLFFNFAMVYGCYFLCYVSL